MHAFRLKLYHVAVYNKFLKARGLEIYTETWFLFNLNETTQARVLLQLNASVRERVSAFLFFLALQEYQSIEITVFLDSAGR